MFRRPWPLQPWTAQPGCPSQGCLEHQGVGVCWWLRTQGQLAGGPQPQHSEKIQEVMPEADRTKQVRAGEAGGGSCCCHGTAICHGMEPPSMEPDSGFPGVGLLGVCEHLCCPLIYTSGSSSFPHEELALSQPATCQGDSD